MLSTVSRRPKTDSCVDMARLGYNASHMRYGSGAGEDLKTRILRFQLIRKKSKSRKGRKMARRVSAACSKMGESGVSLAKWV